VGKARRAIAACWALAAGRCCVGRAVRYACWRAWACTTSPDGCIQTDSSADDGSGLRCVMAADSGGGDAAGGACGRQAALKERRATAAHACDAQALLLERQSRALLSLADLDAQERARAADAAARWQARPRAPRTGPARLSAGSGGCSGMRKCGDSMLDSGERGVQAWLLTPNREPVHVAHVQVCASAHAAGC